MLLEIQRHLAQLGSKVLLPQAVLPQVVQPQVVQPHAALLLLWAVLERYTRFARIESHAS